MRSPAVTGSGNVRGKIAASRFNDEANGLALSNPQQSIIDQPPVHNCVEIFVIDRIINVAVDVIIIPTRRKLQATGVIGACFQLQSPRDFIFRGASHAMVS